jgi:DNA-binding MarR family transcriptional regulator
MVRSVKQSEHYRQVLRLVSGIGRLTNPQHLPALSERRIPLSQFLVLDALAATREPIRMAELARQAGLTSTELSRVVAELEARKYVVRRTDPDDSRARLVAPTATGRRLQRSVQEQATEELAEVWDDFTHDEWHHFIDYLTRFELGLRRARGAPEPR